MMLGLFCLFVVFLFCFLGGGVVCLFVCFVLCFLGLILYIVESVCCAQCMSVERERERDR